MNNHEPEICPRCARRAFKTWNQLTADEKIVAAAKMPFSRKRELAEKRHRFCTKCWFEEIEQSALI